ncbi:cell division protein FtsQ/DivIB [Acidithiobacillus sp. M4-SHS-6]|uniref:cell division protein FtsQ/DivIB n=1 Tax=Acidithiobacillus sp. M4-SHS-6 TaxID=3383024 RepID=UPI0039BE87D1
MVSVMRDYRHGQQPQRPAATLKQASQPPRRTPVKVHKPLPWKLYGRMLLGSLGISLLAWGGWAGWQWIRQPSLMPINTLTISGSSTRIPLAEINSVLKPYAAQGFLWVSPEQIRQSLDKLPWVADAEVRRVWPDRLQVSITPYTPVARWLGGAGQMVDAQGQIFSVPPAQVPNGLPNIAGPAHSGSHLLAQLAKFNAIVAPLGLKVISLEEDQRGGWRCILSNHVRLLLGSEDVIPALKRWVAIVPQVKEYLVAGATMDLRYTNGFAVAMPSATPVNSQ